MLTDLIDSSLEGHAARWYQLIRGDISNWTQFQSEFLNKYWNREVQKAIKNRIETEHYRNQGTLTRAEYFIERVITLQSITPRMDPEEIVQIMSERFDQLIQDSRSVQNITTIRDFERLLHREDLKDSQNKNRRSSTSNEHRQDNNRPNSPRNERRSPPVDTRAYPYSKNRNWNQNSNFNGRNNNHQRPNWSQPNQNGHQQRPYQQSNPHYNNQNHNNYNNHRPNNNPPPNRSYPTQEQQQVCTFVRTRTQSPDRNVPMEHNSNTDNNAHPASDNNKSASGALNH